MSLLRWYAAAAAGMVKRDATIFLSYRARFVTTVVSGLFSLALFYYISRLVSVAAFESPDDYFAFAVVGLIVLEVLAATLTLLPTSVRQELVAGTFERLVVSPCGAVAAITAMTVFPFMLALAHGTLTLGLAALVFGMPVAWSTAPLAIPVAFLGALAFAPFAILLAGTVLVFKQAGLGAGFFVTGISLVAGFFFPVALLPAWLEWLSDVQPFTPALDLLRHLLVGTELETSPWTAVVRLTVFAAVLLPLALAALNSSLHFAQRRGTVIEY
jgi:ABC-2 type transport system permease protein